MVLVLAPHVGQLLHNLVLSPPQLLLHLPHLHFDLVVYPVSHLLRYESEPPFLSLTLVELFPLLVKLPVPAGVRALGHPVGRSAISSPEAWKIFVIADPGRWQVHVVRRQIFIIR